MNFSRTTVCSDATEFSYSPEKQLHIIGVEQYTDVVENHQYSVEKPNKTQWFEMTPLWDTRCHPDTLGNSVADSYPFNSPC
jgi:hypothetical protein